MGANCWSTNYGDPAKATLELVEAIYVPDAVPGSRAVYADANRVYAAGYSGTLWVLSRSPGFSIVAEIVLSDTPLSAVRGNASTVFVSSMDGFVYAVSKNTLQVVGAEEISFNLTSGLDIYGGNIFAGVGGISFAVNDRYVFLSQLNPGEVVYELDPALSELATYGEPFDIPFTTRAFNRLTGESEMEMPNPIDILGRPSQVDMFSTNKHLMVTIPGCCGYGVFIHDASTLELLEQIWIPYANTVVQKEEWLVLGTEAGYVDLLLFGNGEGPSVQLDQLDLPALTGFYEPEDIEVRSLFSVGLHVFAGNSWGDPSAPSLFDLKIVTAN
jgi:hypothetical protein